MILLIKCLNFFKLPKRFTSMEYKKNQILKQNILFIFILIVGIYYTTNGQDAHFSQFYASPLTMNPATAGTYKGTFRISTIYRDQWRSALDNPLKTFAISGDVNFDLKYHKNAAPDKVALGITFFGDRVSLFDFNTNEVVLTAAYHKVLNARNKQYLGVGVQGGVFQKSVNYEFLSFQDQYNSIDGYTLGTAENLPFNNRAYADISLGVYYTVSPSKNTTFHAGLGYFHTNKPNISYYNSDDIINNNLIRTDILNPKLSIHSGISFKTTDKLWLEPRINYLNQGSHSELNLGTTFRYKLDPQSAKYLLIGPYLRGVKNYNNFGLESFIAMAGVELNNFILGFSYDQNLGSLIKDRRSLSSFEISIIYIGEHSNEDNFCPQW